MIAQQSNDGTWHCCVRFAGRVLMGYGDTRAEAVGHCRDLLSWARALEV